MNRRQRKRQPRNHLNRFSRLMKGVTEEWINADELLKEAEADPAAAGITSDELRALLDELNAQMNKA